ncbi:MAG: dihydrolipoyl dehydrogenase [Thiohalobacterales bacterium]|nr:dihydrolipoyl dehydrogenase [Thiohalobacterales bacterium]
MKERQVDVAIIGSGSAGLYALGKVRPSGKSFVLINGGELGTTCARVGCMPSKAVIQVAEDYHRRNVFNRYGIEGHEDMQLSIPEAMEYVQDLRDIFVERVVSRSTDTLPPENFIEGYARFVETDLLAIDNGEHIRANRIIIATGSRPVVPASWEPFRDRVITSDEFFELEDLPQSVAVIGLGVIGLEIGQSLGRLGIEVTGIDQLQTIARLSDPEVAATAIEVIGREMPLWLGHSAEVTEADNGQLRVQAGDQAIEVERVFASMGRTPNLDKLGLADIGVELDARGIPVFDPRTMRIGDTSIYIAGDVTGERPLLHEAGDEGRIAGHNAIADEPVAFRRKVPLSITFCDPNLVLVGARFADLDPDSTAVGEVRMGPVGRAMIMAKNRGLIRVYAEKGSGRLLGAEMACPRGENLGHLLAWSIQQGMTVGELLQMPFYHPVIEEALQAALYDLYGKVDMKNATPITELVPL